MSRGDAGDVRRLLEGSDLPEAVRDRILAVVAAGGLPASEQVDVARELIAHFEDGLSAGRSEAELLGQFGDVTAAAALIRRVKRAARGRTRRRERLGRAGDSVVFVVLRDLRYATRRMRQSPAFTLLAIVSLALGIGANTAIFSVVNGLLLQRLPMRDPDAVVEIYETSPDFEFNVFSYPNAVDFEERTASVFEALSYGSLTLGQLADGDEIETVIGEVVNGDYFATIGLEPTLGRLLTADDNRVPGSHAVAVISFSFWQRRYLGDPAVLGETLTISGIPLTIVGVAPAQWRGMLRRLDPAFYAPASMVDRLERSSTSRLEARGMHSWFTRGRLRDGVGIDHARQAAAAYAVEMRSIYPEAWTSHDDMLILPSSEVVLFPSMDGPLTVGAWLLLGVVGMVLLLACANLAGYLMARAVDRRREIAVRLAMGATRGKLVGQLLVETVLLGAVGGAAGLGAAAVFLRWLRVFELPFPIPLSFEFAIDARVLGFAAAVSITAGLLFGIFPALQSTRSDLVSTLRDEAAGAGRGGRSRLRSALVVGQVAVSVVLLVVAGLMLRSVSAIYRLDPGFGRQPSVIVTAAAPVTVYTPQQAQELFGEMASAFATLPGVAAVGHIGNLHLNQANTQWARVQVDGVPPPTGRDNHLVDWAPIDPTVLDALGIRIVEGRNFDAADTDEGQAVGIVSEALARDFFPGGAVGATLRDGDEEVTVVGVASDTLVRQIGEAYRPFLYRPSAQSLPEQVTFVIRASRSTAGLPPLILARLREMAPDLLVYEAKTMEEHLEVVRFPTRLMANAFGLFAGLALALAVIGLYGLMSYTQAQRVREVGIRMSLGAGPRAMVRLMVAGGLRLVAIGLLVGLAAAVGLARVASSLLFGVGPWDPATWTAVSGSLALVALIAAWLPARRASRVDPVTALRSE